MRKPPLQDVIVKAGPSSRPMRPSAIHEEVLHRPRTAVTRGIESTHSVALPSRHRHEEYQGYERTPEVDPYAPVHHERDSYGGEGRGGERRWLYVALSIGALIVTSAVVLSFMFAGASVTAYPKQDTVVANTSFLAATNGESGALPFEQLVLERTATKSVPAQAEQEVEERASGKITVFNAYAETPQRLIKNTRFQSEGGKIYRIKESIEVPGKKSDAEPGSVEVSVYAEEPGEEYNIAPGSFTVPGFAKLPQEGKVYAKSTAAMAGGFKGKRRTVEDSARQGALKELEQQLRDELLAAAFESSDRPQGYYLFKEAVFFEFNSLPDEVSGEDQVTLSLTGKIHSVLFPEEPFARRVAELTIGSYTGTPIRIDNPYDLAVTIAPSGTAAGTEDAESTEATDEGASPAWQATSFDVKVEGKAHFIWEFDEKKLAEDLVGKEKTVLDTREGGLLSAYPGIDKIQATVRPFWKSTFPAEVEDIVVVTELDA
jgi:hypothetical protein